MRGDSLRDFYAKVLAVLGLGLLACAGAAVDYWPMRVEPPTVARAIRVPGAPALVQHLDIAVPAPVIRPRAVAHETGWRAEPVAAVIAGGHVPLGMPVRITEATLPLPVAPAVSVSAVALPLADPPSFSPPAEPVPSAPASSGDDDSNGFFTGAVRKTRDSIVHTGVVTGSSIAGAFRGVFGMFKKVNPF